MSKRRLRSLYICYLSLDDPLTHTQVVAYLSGLSRGGHELHLLTFETAPLSRHRRRALRAQMAAEGIAWHGLRYHKRPSLPATAFDTIAGALYACALTLRFRLDVLHARNHVPAAMALLARRLLGRRKPALIFDMRGLMAEEYVDAGHWREGSAPFRLVKAVERAALRHADGIVVLTERVRRQVFGDPSESRVFVIPCCADFDHLAGADPAPRRSELGLGDAPVMIYVGKLEGWYMAAEMADFYAAARELTPDLRFLILTQGSDAPLRDRLAEIGVTDGFTIASAAADDIGGYLAAANFGISFIRPAPSKASSSPTKVGEYLAAGLPVLATAGVGDLDTLISSDVGVLVAEHTAGAYAAAAGAITALAADAQTAGRCTALARRELALDGVGVPRYLALYEHVSGVITSRGDAGTARA